MRKICSLDHGNHGGRQCTAFTLACDPSLQIIVRSSVFTAKLGVGPTGGFVWHYFEDDRPNAERVYEVDDIVAGEVLARPMAFLGTDEALKDAANNIG